MKFNSKLLVLSCFILFSYLIFSCNGQPSKNTQTIDAKAFAEKIEAIPNAQILDVRTPPEFSSDHIDKAVNIDWLGDSFVASAEKLDKTKPVFVYCKSGGRSTQAKSILEQNGFHNVINGNTWENVQNIINSNR